MAELLQPAKPTRGRPPLPVVCRDTGRTFNSTAEAVAWLDGQGRPATVGGLENALCEGGSYKGYKWRRPPRPEGAAGRGPLKGAKYGPRVAARPVAVIPQTPVVDGDGNAYPDAHFAAAAMRAAGLDADAAGVVRAILSQETYGGWSWDWKGRGWCYCGNPGPGGDPCEDCRRRMSGEAGPVPA